MKQKFLSGVLVVAICLLSSTAGWSQTANPCDLNNDGVVDLRDMWAATTMALGSTSCPATVTCNVSLLQQVTNAVRTGTCGNASGLLTHTVSLTWTASTSGTVIGYYLYRSAQANGPYNRLTSSPVAAFSYTDGAVQSGQTYYYVVTAVDLNGNESVYSNEANAVIPSP